DRLAGWPPAHNCDGRRLRTASGVPVPVAYADGHSAEAVVYIEAQERDTLIRAGGKLGSGLIGLLGGKIVASRQIQAAGSRPERRVLWVEFDRLLVVLLCHLQVARGDRHLARSEPGEAQPGAET